MELFLLLVAEAATSALDSKCLHGMHASNSAIAPTVSSVITVHSPDGVPELCEVIATERLQIRIVAAITKFIPNANSQFQHLSSADNF